MAQKNFKKILTLGIAALVLGVSALLVHKANAGNVYNAGNGKFTWYSGGINDSTSEIWTSDRDGANKSNVTNNTDNEGNPQWSPDQSKIIFDAPPDSFAATDNRHSLFVIKPDGTDRTLILNLAASGAKGLGTSICTDTDGYCPLFDGTFSPDGSKIAFLMLDGVAGSKIVTADYNNTNDTVTNLDILAPAGGGEPHFNSDGTLIAFKDGNDQKLKAYKVSDKSLAWSSAADSTWGSSPQFGPQTDKDMLVATKTGGKIYIFEVVQGQNNVEALTWLTKTGAGSITWSPDGKKLAYGSGTGGTITTIDYATKATSTITIPGYNTSNRIGEVDWTYEEGAQPEFEDVSVECTITVPAGQSANGKTCEVDVPEFCTSALQVPPEHGTSTIASGKVTYTNTSDSTDEESYAHIRDNGTNTAVCNVIIKFVTQPGGGGGGGGTGGGNGSVNVPKTGIVGGLAGLGLAAAIAGGAIYAKEYKANKAKKVGSEK